MSSKDVLTNNIKGEIRYSAINRSYYGKSIYFASKNTESRLIKEFGGVDFSVLNAKILDDANIVEFADMSEYIKDIKKLSDKIPDKNLAHLLYNCNENTNMLFMNEGIDIIKITKDNYYVVLNRGALVTHDE